MPNLDKLIKAEDNFYTKFGYKPRIIILGKEEIQLIKDVINSFRSDFVVFTVDRTARWRDMIIVQSDRSSEIDFK